jgi:DNA-binding Lrp family transcriptional regulator
MPDATERLDDILTAATNYREELAREIMERVVLLEGQISAMKHAAEVLAGREQVEERGPPGDQREMNALAARNVKLQQELETAKDTASRLIAEVKNLRAQSQAEPKEPLSEALATKEEEVQEARELAASRQRELDEAIKRVDELEARLREADEQINEAMRLAEGQGAMVLSEQQLVGEVMLKDSGPTGDPRPVFGFPKANRHLFDKGMERLRERFQVYLLADGSVLYKPTGTTVPTLGTETRRPPEAQTSPEEAAGRYGPAWSPKPVAEMRSLARGAEERLVGIVQFLQQHHSEGTFNTVDLAKDMGATASQVGSDVRKLEDRGVVQRVGNVYPRELKAVRAAGANVGRPAIEYQLAEELRQVSEVAPQERPPRQSQPEPRSGPEHTDAVTEGEAQARVRDYMVDSLKEGEMASAQQVAQAVELPTEATLGALEALVRRGSLKDVSPSEDMRLFTYAGAPKGPGRAAELQRGNGEHEEEAVSRFSGGGSSGSKVKAPHKDVQDLINAAQRAGARVKHEASGHFAVTLPGSGKRILISSTPSNPRSVLNDRARLRRAGLAIA